MAITSIATVKIMADLYTRVESGMPNPARTGAIGDIWLDNDPDSETYGNTYLCSDIIAGTPVTYKWDKQTQDDAKITLSIKRAENDYLSLRGIPFSNGYPDGADFTAAEMVCYLNNWGQHRGRGAKTESLGDRASTYDEKLRGYPLSIVSTIERFQRGQ
jgi:hypothetical protein